MSPFDAMGKADTMNENIKLWILDEDRKRNRQKAAKELAPSKKKHFCVSCKKDFDEPKLVQVCPHCQARLKEESVGSKCRYWFGYLNQKDKTEELPRECVECDRVMDCMLTQEHSSVARSEIKKWYG
jgi:hypothetical protein